MTEQEIVKTLKSWADPKNKAGMIRFGISAKGTLGVAVPKLRLLAKKIGPDYELALRIWSSGIHEARILATMIVNPLKLSAQEADAWVRDFDSWDICDQACQNALRRTPYAWKKVALWAKSEKEFVRRAGFALLAALAVGDKEANDKIFLAALPLIKKYSVDERNFVKKAVNWALRQIGKRNLRLNAAALKLAQDIKKIDSAAARWIANDAIRELTDLKVISRLKKR